MTRSIYLDSNTFICAFEMAGSASEAMGTLIDAGGQGDFCLVTSELTLAELLQKPLATGSDGLVQLYTAMISEGPALDVVPISRAILVASAGLRAQHRALKLPDAIHIATAMHRSCAVIVSDDRRLPALTHPLVLPISPDMLATIQRLPA